MGAFFSNLHIKKKSDSYEAVRKTIFEHFAAKGYTFCSEEDCDFSVSIYSPADTQWISVYSEAFTPSALAEISSRISEITNTDVLNLNCVDSDYLSVNFVNVTKDCDLRLNIGRLPDGAVNEKSNMLAWENIVEDFDAFQKIAEMQYVLAEDFLLEFQRFFDISYSQLSGCVEGSLTERLFFKATQNQELEPVDLHIDTFPLDPCRPDERFSCTALNKGARSTGVLVAFVGNYIEHDEIIIDNATFFYYDGNKRIEKPITFEKRQNIMGDWLYLWHDKDFVIPEGVSPTLPPKKKYEKENENSFGITFYPRGNARKFLDICIVFSPLANREKGSCCWYVWRRQKSKREFLEKYNKEALDLQQTYGAPITLLNPEDYDLE